MSGWRRTALILTAGLVLLTGCAGAIALPGSDETVNRSIYKTPDDLMDRLRGLRPGMPQADVFTVLGRQEKDMDRLERNEILISLYGSSSVEFRDGKIGQDEQSRFLQSLYGYRFNYKKVEKEHGFASLIRIRTDEDGYDYNVTLVFQNGVLFEAPIVTGGAVHKTSSKTIFDYLNPGNLLKLGGM